MSDVSEPVLRVIEAEGQASEARAVEERQPAGMLRTLARLCLGATLLAVEVVTDQLRKLEEQSAAQPLPPERSIQSVLIPADQWETTLRNEREGSPRHILLGLMLDTQSRLSSTAGAILRRGEYVAGRTLGIAVKPLRTSRVLSPVRVRFEGLVERGQAEVNRWQKLGQAEEARSRALAQSALTRLVDGSVDVIAENSRIQVFIQEIVEEQGLGLVDEAIEEVRERTVTGDMLLERFVRSHLRRPPRESLPAPTEIIHTLPRPGTKSRG